MSVRESPRRSLAAVGGIGVLAWSLTVFFLFAYPLLVLPEATEPAYLEAWFQPTVTVAASYGVPLLVIAGATAIGAVGALAFGASRSDAVE